MNIEIARVEDNSDVTQSGRLKVSLDSLQGYIWAKYTSPYLGVGGEGGLIAIPEEGSRILVVQPDNSIEWFYMSTIADPHSTGNALADQKFTNRSELFPDRDIYSFRGKPLKMGLYSPKGGKLVLSDSYNPKAINIKVELKSHLGKVVQLNDSSKMDCIVSQSRSTIHKYIFVVLRS